MLSLNEVMTKLTVYSLKKKRTDKIKDPAWCPVELIQRRLKMTVTAV